MISEQPPSGGRERPKNKNGKKNGKKKAPPPPPPPPQIYIKESQVAFDRSSASRDSLADTGPRASDPAPATVTQPDPHPQGRWARLSTRVRVSIVSAVAFLASLTGVLAYLGVGPDWSGGGQRWRTLGGVEGMEHWCADKGYEEVVLQKGAPNPYWWCTKSEDRSTLDLKVDMDSACQEQYDTETAEAYCKDRKDPGSWYCRAPEE